MRARLTVRSGPDGTLVIFVELRLSEAEEASENDLNGG